MNKLDVSFVLAKAKLFDLNLVVSQSSKIINREQ